MKKFLFVRNYHPFSQIIGIYALSRELAEVEYDSLVLEEWMTTFGYFLGSHQVMSLEVL